MVKNKGAEPIALNKVQVSASDRTNIEAALSAAHLSESGLFTKACDAWLEARMQSHALTVNSGTAALELSCLLADLKPGDEVIMPSFTFPSTANAVVLRGATPVFVDIDPNTLNIDPHAIEPAITPKTRAIFVMHYAGVGCAMDEIIALAKNHGLLVLEDAAQAICADYKDRPLGTIGNFGALSFHATKNISGGQAGAIFIRDKKDFHRAQIFAEKGTNRSAFLRGEVDKYSWQDVGCNYRPPELTAALLAAQLERADRVTSERIAVWDRYHEALAPWEELGALRRPIVPEGCRHNGHIYYILLPSEEERNRVMDAMRAERITATFHYVPLHEAPAGRRYGRASGKLPITCDAPYRLLRLPIYPDLSLAQQDRVVGTLGKLLAGQCGASAKRA